jgi:cation transport regulator ChaC
VFDQAFNLFWRDPTAAEQAVAMALLDAQKEKHKERPPSGTRRVAEAMARLDEALVATHLVTASGSLGSCLAYLTETLEALQVAGLRDYSLERLRKMGEGQPCWRRHGHAVISWAVR